VKVKSTEITHIITSDDTGWVRRPSSFWLPCLSHSVVLGKWLHLAGFYFFHL
jgi:hypothetical protein